MMELTYQMFLEQVIANARTARSRTTSIVDSHFLDLMADPVAVAAPARTSSSSSTWPAGHDRGRRATTSRPSRRASTARTATRSPTSGSTKTSVRATFARYVAHYGITEE